MAAVLARQCKPGFFSQIRFDLFCGQMFEQVIPCIMSESQAECPGCFRGEASFIQIAVSRLSPCGPQRSAIELCSYLVDLIYFSYRGGLSVRMCFFFRQNNACFRARNSTASGNSMRSYCMRKLNALPPAPQPKQWYICLSAETMNDAVFSRWNGQQALKFLPDFLSGIYADINSTISARPNISSNTASSIKPAII